MQGGNIDQLVGKIQQATGEGREAIEKFLTGLTGKGSEAVAKTAEQVNQFAQSVAPKVKEQYGQLSDGAREKLWSGPRARPPQPVAVRRRRLRRRDRRRGPGRPDVRSR